MKFGKLLALGAALAISLAAQPASAGDAAKGAKVFKKCKACHTAKAGKHKVGPSLFAVVGRKAGPAEGYTKYEGLKGADWTWDEAMLDAYLTNPKKFVKGKTGLRTSMTFKLKKEKDRANVIEHLKTLK